MKAAVYLRVSSRDGRQDEANQEPACLQLCEARGWEPVIFRERESGAKDRPEWERVKEAARVGAVRAVVVFSTSRVGRRRSKLVRDLWELAYYGAAVVSCTERIIDIPAKDADSSPLVVAMRDFAIGWLAWSAEQERIDDSNRTKAGLVRAVATGKTLGRPAAAVNAVALERALHLRRNLADDGSARRPLGWRRVAAQLHREGWPRWSWKTVLRAVNGTKTVPGYEPSRPTVRATATGSA